jgi:GT2 family glycosyltransferase
MKQSTPPAEIVVVDNAPSSDDTMNFIASDYPDVRYRREHLQGLDFARNRALSETTCDIVAFMDDDVVVAENWIAAILATFRGNNRIAICTGKVDALSQETEGQRLFEENGGFSCGTRSIRLPAESLADDSLFHRPLIAWSISVGAGCSFAIRRTTATQLGGFDEALDLGAALPGGGDHDMIWRVLLAGHDVVYAPSVHAWHDHRKNIDAAIKQILGHNGATIAMLTKAMIVTPGRQKITVLAFLGWRLVKPGVRLLRRAVGKDPLPVAALLKLWWTCWQSLLAYPAARRLAAQRVSQGPVS